MWITAVRDNETDEDNEIFVLDNSELQELIEFVKMNPNLDICHLEERFIIGDVNSFKEIITGENNG